MELTRCRLRHPYAARLPSLVSTTLQEGQRNMNCSGRTPSLEMVRKCFMVSPHERHTMVGALSGTKGERSMARVETASCGMCVSTETGGSATGLSAIDAWRGAAVVYELYVRLIGAVTRLSFRQNARNLHSTNGGNIARPSGPRNFPVAPVRLATARSNDGSRLYAYGGYKWRAT
jgi:hypothetical protein